MLSCHWLLPYSYQYHLLQECATWNLTTGRICNQTGCRFSNSKGTFLAFIMMVVMILGLNHCDNFVQVDVQKVEREEATIFKITMFTRILIRICMIIKIIVIFIVIVIIIILISMIRRTKWKWPPPSFPLSAREKPITRWLLLPIVNP